MFPHVIATEEMIEALCGAAATLGVASLRAGILVMRAACLAAARAGRDRVSAEDAGLAARLVLAPRATSLPPDQAEPPPAPEVTQRRPRTTPNRTNNRPRRWRN